jgi:hypothetical protein
MRIGGPRFGRCSAALAPMLSAALLFLGSEAHAAGATSTPATGTEVVVSDQARARFEAGVQLLQDPDGARYEEAYEEFKAAFADSPSWKILGNLALCAMKLERDGEAISALERSLAEGQSDLDPADRAQQEQDLKLLKGRAATLTIQAPPQLAVLDERVTVNGASIKNRYVIPDSGELVILVRPGTHRVTAQFESGLEVQEATLDSGSTAEMKLRPAEVAPPAPAEPVVKPAPEPTQPSSGGSKVPAFISLGVGAAGVIAGGVFLGLHLDSSGQASELFNSCAESKDCGASEVSRTQKLDEDAALQGTVSLISFGVGAVGIGTGIALLVMQPKQENPVAGKLTFRPFASAHSFGVRGYF